MSCRVINLLSSLVWRYVRSVAWTRSTVLPYSRFGYLRTYGNVIFCGLVTFFTTSRSNARDTFHRGTYKSKGYLPGTFQIARKYFLETSSTSASRSASSHFSANATRSLKFAYRIHRCSTSPNFSHLASKYLYSFVDLLRTTVPRTKRPKELGIWLTRIPLDYSKLSNVFPKIRREIHSFADRSASSFFSFLF